ncbi:MAG TPA: DNA methyltransferase [Dehalococcoidia bacterium]|nr:DNA methyltransferase [Dehalococcoidia bacterium]
MVAKPFLKWAGGKGKLAPLIVDCLDQHSIPIRRYHEPFLGGGSVFFALQELSLFQDAFIGDGNPNLIATYQVIRDDVASIIAALATLSRQYLMLEESKRPVFYYQVRDRRRPRMPSTKAARLLFLNKTCYNGLYRVNSQGHFNVPHGRHKRPRILDRAGLQEASKALTNVTIEALDFEEACNRAQSEDFVYLDPPYQPLSETSVFTSYTRDGFGIEEQYRLREVFENLTARGVPTLLSNSDHPLIRDLYKGYYLQEVPMGRNINSKATQRSAINELLISNLEQTKNVGGSPSLGSART